MIKSKKMPVSGLISEFDEYAKLVVGQVVYLHTGGAGWKKCVIASKGWHVNDGRFAYFDLETKKRHHYYNGYDENPVDFTYRNNKYHDTSKFMRIVALNEFCDGEEVRSNPPKTIECPEHKWQDITALGRILIALKICKLYMCGDCTEMKANFWNPLYYPQALLVTIVMLFGEGFSNFNVKDWKRCLAFFPKFYPYDLVWLSTGHKLNPLKKLRKQ